METQLPDANDIRGLSELFHPELSDYLWELMSWHLCYPQNKYFSSALRTAFLVLGLQWNTTPSNVELALLYRNLECLDFQNVHSFYDRG